MNGEYRKGKVFMERNVYGCIVGLKDGGIVCINR